jgi:hypothetical protein
MVMEKIFNFLKILKNKFGKTQNLLIGKFVLFVPDITSFVSANKIKNILIISNTVFVSRICSIFTKNRTARCFGIKFAVAI